MGNNFRHRLEYDRPRRFPVASDIEVHIGDLVWFDKANTTIKKASELTYTSEAASQEAFAKAFAGLSSQHSPVGVDAHIDPSRVETGGIAEFSCDSGTWEIGDLVAVAPNGGGTALEDQKVKKVTNAKLAIGKCARRETSNVATVMVELFPPVAAAPGCGPDSFVRFEHVVTSDEDTAGYTDLDTGFGVVPTHIQVTITTVTTGALKASLLVTKRTGGDAGKVRIADNGGTTVTAGDTIYLAVWK